MLSAPNTAVNFAFKDFFRGFFASFSIQSAFGNFLSGGAAGVSTSMIFYPLQNARTALAMDTGVGKKRIHTGIFDFFRNTFSTAGFGGIYSGFGIVAVSSALYRGMFFGLYDTVTDWMPDAGLASRFALGYTTTNAAIFFSYPLDTLRRRLLMTRETGKYKNALDCARKILSQEGLKAFSGMVNLSLWNQTRCVFGAVTLVAFDYGKRAVMERQEAKPRMEDCSERP